MKIKFISTLVILLNLSFIGCNKPQPIDTTPHEINPKADVFYQQALALMVYYDNDSTRKCINFLNKALTVDSLNPDYYGVKAKLYAELGLLDSALIVQRYADRIGAINGEYLLQQGLFEAAKGFHKEAQESFKRSNDFLSIVIKEYPDSLTAFINQQAANSLYLGVDSVFMHNIKDIRKQYPDRLMEIEMTRRLKPSSLILQIQKIEENSLHDLAVEMENQLDKAAK